VPAGKLGFDISTYPYSKDVRVSQVNHFNNEVLLSCSTHTLSSGDTLNFSADIDSGLCVAKQFDIQYIVPQSTNIPSQGQSMVGTREIEWYFETTNIAPTSSQSTTYNITGFDI